MPGTPKKRAQRAAAAAEGARRCEKIIPPPPRKGREPAGYDPSIRGRQCERPAEPGSDPPRCRHCMTKAEFRKDVVVREVRGWGLGEEYVDPSETLLRLVAQSAHRVGTYSDELAEMVGEEGLRKALIGEVRVPTESGSYVSGDYIRGLARLEAEERDRLANFSRIAVQAGLKTRQVELAEAQGRLMADVLRAVFAAPELGLSDEQMAAVPGLLRMAQQRALEITAPAPA